MRTHCLHVDLPLCLQDGRVFWPRGKQNSHVYRHGHISIRIHGVRQWNLLGRLSDKIGRKKVLLGGMFGTGLSMLLFGFAQSLPMALFARALGGLLNG